MKAPEPVVRRYARFSDTWRFPAFDKIDTEHGLIGSPFYEEDEDRWCLLAEIIDVSLPVRVRLVVRDRDGQNFVVAFYPDNRDAGNLDVGKLRVGHTNALAYPRQRMFLDGTQGVRVEDLSSYRVFPVSLDKLFQINAELRGYTGPLDAPKRCYTCMRPYAPLSKCGGCGFYFYCTKICQADHWDKFGHNQECKVLRDPNFVAMINITDGEGETRFRFPV
ncbi:hypothetical protein CMUS01_14881 [Colletotrichum musicola]|uniref:MYND-type domain-containing protein n=1 Tax=Colletotrichum musicola TaxID=2175873 RepID=A0A8H6J0S3_9PEZI|nr:hypothetical protein CMUS01_14881 [Colletotrichum musicola]